MNLYLISQEENDGCDTYSDAVVAALSADEARTIYPGGGGLGMDDWIVASYWVSDPSKVAVKLIGTAKAGVKSGVLCASFHAS
jgi:hypothetical protein